MGPRARYLPLVAVLGVVLGGLPAFATSAGSTPAINGLESKMWSPSEVTIGPGGSVIFKNASTTLEHAVRFMPGPGETGLHGGARKRPDPLGRQLHLRRRRHVQILLHGAPVHDRHRRGLRLGYDTTQPAGRAPRPHL